MDVLHVVVAEAESHLVYTVSCAPVAHDIFIERYP
jgi:hypothetical protein